MKRLIQGSLAVFALFLSARTAPAQENLSAYPQVDTMLNDAVQTGLIPGAVLVIGHNGQVVYRKAYGSRALLPQREAMTLDTIFDAASLTKVVATTPAVMKLFENGKLRLDDRSLPTCREFQGGKESHHHSSPDDAFFGNAS